MGSLGSFGRTMGRPLVAGLLVAAGLTGAVTAVHMAVSRADEAPGAARGRAAAADVGFLRMTRDAAGEPEALETSVIHYREKRPDQSARRPLEVDLVGAVHVGSRSYYATLDHLFRDYDAVLYELVAPDNARVPKPGRKPAGAIGSAQQGLTSVLGLEFQLEQIDYAAPNFVHADLSPKEFDAAMAKRGESWWTMFSKLMREGMKRAERDTGRGSDIGLGDMFGMLFGSGPDRAVRLRRMMAEQFTDMEVLTSAFGGEEGSTLITDRNAAALDVLREQIGKGRRRIAIFYGAAHMDDFDRRLKADFGLEPVETDWIEAWDLRKPSAR
ncbi:MAG: hypothetical protein EBR86_00330 [Planctomycetia bacterium]|nr:hypothetical protein [Planctomycetia bacterium]